jgi:thioredoxin-like negative regulator of GroEL
MSVPTLILYQGGREVNRWIGLTPVDTIKKKLGEVAEKKK